jgi:hypothetical protein
MIKVIFSDKAQKDFASIVRGDKKSAIKIAETIKRYAEDETGTFDI